MLSETTENYYTKQIEELKNELTSFKKEQMTMNSMKSLHHHNESNHHDQNLKL